MAWLGVAAARADQLGDCVIAGKVHIHDLHATMRHLLGHDFRLTDVHGSIVKEILV